ncbi:MAG: hypothetical protein WBV55_13000 [Candidatus Sulfotelmatobacter sp.]
MKLTQAKVDKIRARYAAGGVKQMDLAAEYGIATSTLSQVVTGQRWANLPPKKPIASVRDYNTRITSQKRGK